MPDRSLLKSGVKEFTTPSRQGLIFGAVIVAIHGLRQERITAAIIRKHVDDYMLDGDVIAVTKVQKQLEDWRQGLPVVLKTTDKTIIGMLALTQQALRVSYEEWDTIIKVEEK